QQVLEKERVRVELECSCSNETGSSSLFLFIAFLIDQIVNLMAVQPPQLHPLQGFGIALAYPDCSLAVHSPVAAHGRGTIVSGGFGDLWLILGCHRRVRGL